MPFSSSISKLTRILLPLAAALLSGCGSGVHVGGTSSGTAVAAAAGPQLGYFWNSADQTLRPVLGIAGASQVGSSVVPAGVYTIGAASAVSGFGVLQEPDGSLDVASLPSGSPQHAPASTAAGSTVRFSPLGTAAVVFAPGAQTATVLTGLGATNTVSSVAVPGTLTDAAVSDAGHLAYYTPSATGAALVLSAPGVPARTVASVSLPGGLAFASGDTLVFADAGGNAAYQARTVSTTPAISTLPSASLLNGPAALSVSPGGRWLAVSNGGEASVVRLDLSAQTAPLRLSCTCTPVTSVPLAGSGAFRLTEPGKGPLWAADLAADTPRIFFIPALP